MGGRGAADVILQVEKGDTIDVNVIVTVRKCRGPGIANMGLL